MVNVYSCLRGNKTSAKYQMNPLSVNEYLNVTENDMYDGIDANEYMINFLEQHD